MGLLRQLLALISPHWICLGDHSEPMLRLFCLFFADGDLMAKVLLGFCPVCLHVICADTGCCSYYLTEKRIVDRVLKESLYKFNDCFAKLSSSFFEVVPLFVVGILSFVIWDSFVLWILAFGFHLSFGLCPLSLFGGQDWGFSSYC